MSAFVNRRRFLAPAIVVSIMVLLAGCAASRSAPVSDARPAPGKVEMPPANKPADSAPTVGSTATPTAGDAPKPADGARLHVVQRSETLYSIAFQNGLDIRELAAWNNIVNPAVIRVGDTLRLSAPVMEPTATSGTPQPGLPVASPLVFSAGSTPVPEGSPIASNVNSANSAQMKVEPKAGRVPYSDATYAKMLADAGAGAGTGLVSVPVPVPAGASGPAALPALPPTAAPAGNDNIAWAWPVKGKVLTTFTEINKGIDIAGTRGTAVLAAAPGKVIYNESALRGYGRLVIIKHSDNWLSAYAHNEKVLVTVGQDIKKGQKIAEMGSSDTDSVKLHFEIRSKGRPVDPLKFLPPL